MRRARTREGAGGDAPDRRPGGRLRLFWRRREGVTAVEFAIVAVPFFGLLLGIIEVGLLFFAGQVLESSVSSAARLIRTGQAQTQGMSVTDLRTRICDEVSLLASCGSKLKIDVRTYQDFRATGENLGAPIDDDGNLIENFAYQPGVGGDIVLVRAYYEWPTFFPNFGIGPGELADGSRLLVSTVAFRNEPF